MGDEPVKVLEGTTFQQLADKAKTKFATPIMAAIVRNDLYELRKEISEDCEIRFIDLTNIDGMRIYQRSLTFVLIYAIKEVFGKDVNFIIEHSLKKNIYCEQKGDKYLELTEENVQKISDKMQGIINDDIHIEKYSYPLDKGIRLVTENGMVDKAAILKYRRVSTVNLYKLGWLYDYFYGYMASSTGCLKVFKLIKQGDGIMLQFPQKNKPDFVEEYKPITKISNIFKEYSNWGKILKVATVGELNDVICQGQVGNIIRISEALQEKKIAYIADMIQMQKDDIKIVLIAGPSSSGKTTFAQRLCIQLRVNGILPHVISLDNYFKNRDEAPLDENGTPNFEALEYLDVPLMNNDLSLLLKGETVKLPNYNFLRGKREYTGKSLNLGENEVLVIEGIHALNEKLTYSIPKKNKFKIFISALTQLNIDNHNRVTTTDTRMIRRIIRDSKFRGTSAEYTLKMWSSVAKGENDYIFPFQEDADAMFNSALIYEMSILKQFVEPLLFKVSRDMPEFMEAKRLIKFLDCFLGVSSEEVPENSIIREFIGGSCFHT